MFKLKARRLAVAVLASCAAPSPASAASQSAHWREWVRAVSASRNYIAVAVRGDRVEVIRLNDGRGRGNRTADSRIGSREVIDPSCEP